jgi:hypothetical protein
VVGSSNLDLKLALGYQLPVELYLQKYYFWGLSWNIYVVKITNRSKNFSTGGIDPKNRLSVNLLVQADAVLCKSGQFEFSNNDSEF